MWLDRGDRLDLLARRALSFWIDTFAYGMLHGLVLTAGVVVLIRDDPNGDGGPMWLLLIGLGLLVAGLAGPMWLYARGVVRYGATWGMQATGLRVRTHNNRALPSWPRAIGRHVGLVAAWSVPFFSIMQILVAVVPGDTPRSMVDRITGTRVVRTGDLDLDVLPTAEDC